MKRLPGELWQKIFQLLDHQTLATAPQVCRNWKKLASDDTLWSNLFKMRWGEDSAAFFAPQDSKSWKDAYIVQDRCNKYGLGLKIIREGSDYYLIHQGEVQRYLGQSKHQNSYLEGAPPKDEGRQKSLQILDSILFFIGDLEVACSNAKRARM